MTSEEMRIQKYISMSGVCSRRKAEELILKGQVVVDGKIAKLGDKCTLESEVFVDGVKIEIKKKNIYIMLNKPKGYITTVTDPFNRPTVTDLVKKDISTRLFPVGRLDANTTGLLFMTNDGEFANKLMHPKNKIEKTYRALVSPAPISKEALYKLRHGVLIDHKMTMPAKVSIEKNYPDKTVSVLITISEGRNRQVRKMIEAVGYKCLELERISEGKILLGNLPVGHFRHLTEFELKRLL